ncbi:2-phospho-L-lactate transferase [Modestobacter lapidis]|nr:2-phospho-L-lactate transferase [Modestobacter lapidis]
MQIVVLAGGVGGARFLRGVLAAAPGAQVTAVVNTGDDVTLHGLRICPDLDTVMYTLGDGIAEERGWGRRGETWTVKDELAAYGAEPSWFGLGDRDLATHLVRTRMLDAGYPLSAVTAALADRWRPGVRLLPMSDQRVETHVVVTDPTTGRPQAIHFQEWWVRHRAALAAHSFVQVGVDEARPAPGVVEALAAADAVLLAPSNPVVSIGTVLGVPGIREALAAARGRVVGISPIVAGSVVRGMADRCLPVIGVEVTAEGVGRHYGARAEGGVLDAWLVHTGDDATVPGVDVRAVPLLMSSPAATRDLARAALDAALEAAGPRSPHPSRAQGGARNGAEGPDA